MIDIHNLRFGFPESEFRLEIDALQVSSGERVAIVGPSGSGKTTLLNLIAGIWPAQAGRIAVDEARIDEMDDAERRAFRLANIGMVFQTFELIDYLKIKDNILLPCRIGGAVPLDHATIDRAGQLARSCGIEALLERYPQALSQGERQRAAICRALLAQPKLVLADEATGNLDPKTKRLVLDLLFERAAEAGAAVLAVTHDHELLPAFDRQIDFAQYLA